MSYRRGPVPRSSRILVSAIVVGVVLMVVGRSIRVSSVDDSPTEADRRLESQIRALAEADGVESEIHASEIARLRRQGDLDGVFVDAPPGPESSVERARGRFRGAFYRDEHPTSPEPQSVDFPWGWAALAFATMLGSVLAFAVGVGYFVRSDPSEDETE